MIKPTNPYQTIQDTLVERMGKVQQNLADKMGQVGEPVSNKEQMAAFDAMTTEDWIRLTEEKGFSGAKDFYDEMTRRKAISEAQRRPEGV